MEDGDGDGNGGVVRQNHAEAVDPLAQLAKQHSRED